MKIYHWGIIGPGKIAHKFAKDLVQLPNAKLHAIASRDMERAHEFADVYEVTHRFDNYEAMVKNCPNLDIVYVATPHIGHFAAAKLCLENGIAVLCEKPLAMNATEVAALVACAKKHQTFLMEALWTRFLPTTLQYLDIVKAGTIGEIKAIQADFGFYCSYSPESRIFNKTLGGGALLDVGIYPVFLSYLLMGNPTEILAKATFTPTGVDETTSAILSYENGAQANIFCASQHKTLTEAFIYGTKGMIHIYGRFHEPTRGFKVTIYDETEHEYLFEWSNLGYGYEATEAMQCLDNQQIESKLWSWKNSLDLITILDNIREKIGLSY